MPSLSANVNLPIHLASAARDKGLSIQPFSFSSSNLLLLEASSHVDLKLQEIASLMQSVESGMSLLLTMASNPGASVPRLSAMLPTLGCSTRQGFADWAPHGSTEVAWWNAELFGTLQTQLTLDHYFPVPPLSAVERGQTRYERYAWPTNPLAAGAPESHHVWTRPLLNRDWRVLSRAADLAQTPLAVSGRYGAGRLIVLGTSAAVFDRAMEAEALWNAMLGWLLQPPATSTVEDPSTIQVRARTEDRKLRIDIANRGNRPALLEAVVRCSSYEGAMIGDLNCIDPGVRNNLKQIPANSAATMWFTLPEASATSFSAIEDGACFQLRFGILDGGRLLTEGALAADIRSSLQLSIHTQNVLSGKPYPAGPSESEPSNFTARMGSPFERYAFLPGEAIEVRAHLRNGYVNLAPIAEVKDAATGATSVSSLNDGSAVGRKTPIDGVQAYSMWTGANRQENVLSFTFPTSVTVAGIVLTGTSLQRPDANHNPGAVVIEVDGKAIARQNSLDNLFGEGYGLASISFPPVTTKQIILRFPFVENTSQGKRRAEPWLGEVAVMGCTGKVPPEAQGMLRLSFEDAMTGTRQLLAEHPVTVAGCAETVFRTAVHAPQTTQGFYRLIAEFNAAHAEKPVLVLQAPQHALRPITDAVPANAASVGYIVTRGFRNIFRTGTGTAEIREGWGQPDDLVWAYSRQLKQVSRSARTRANRLYVTEDDLRHYSTPWRSFPNGVSVYEVGAPMIVANMSEMPSWRNSDTAVLAHSDRWDNGPELNGLHAWQDFIDFDEFLRKQGEPGLQGKTRVELATEIHTQREDAWYRFQFERYAATIHLLHSSFAAKGKKLRITGQGQPLIPGDKAEEFAEVFQGMNDDSTWGMANSDIPLTTGRQMALFAFNPVFRTSTLLQWNYNSALLNNPQWHSPAGTVEPSRRHLMDRAWRAGVWKDGRYGSVYTFGFSSNAGTSYTMTPEEWEQWWWMQQRHSLLVPEAPLGYGLVISSSQYANPAHLRFSCVTATDIDLVKTVARTFQLLQEARVGISFTANAASLNRWNGSAPLLLLNLDTFSQDELSTIEGLAEKNTPMVALGDSSLYSARVQALVRRPGVHAIAFTPTMRDSWQLQKIAEEIFEHTPAPVLFPEGTTGYGFEMGNMRFLVLEDWAEQGRKVHILIRIRDVRQTNAAACLVNEHHPLEVQRSGEYWQVAVPLRPGDGVLIALQEHG